MPRPKILVVDNQGIIAKGIESKLKRSGYDVPEIALSGEEAVRIANAIRPDLILMDIVMEGGIDGMEAATRINASLDIPIIYVTAHENEEFIQRATQTGPYGYLIKPIETSELHSAIEVALNKHAMEKKLRQQLQRMTVMRRIDEMILANQDLNQTLNGVLAEIAGTLNIDAAGVLLFDAGQQSLICRHAAGPDAGALLGRSYPLGEPYAGLIARCRAPIHEPDLAHSTGLPEAFIPNTALPADAPVPGPALVPGLASPPMWMLEEGFRAYFGLPVINKSGVKGVIEILHRAPVSADDGWLEFLSALVRQVAIAIENASLLDHLHKANNELVHAYTATIEGWSRTLELRDYETQGHSQRVTELTLALAKSFGINGVALEHIERGALLHDIGKLGVPDDILRKPGPLTPEEWERMRRHPQDAYDLLKDIAFLQEALIIPYCHHEKWDGTGYPRGLAGEAIPLAARIFAVVDVWDALRSDRAYRSAWPEDRVIAYLRDQAGKHFDPAVVAAFLRILEEKPQ